MASSVDGKAIGGYHRIKVQALYGEFGIFKNAEVLLCVLRDLFYFFIGEYRSKLLSEHGDAKVALAKRRFDSEVKGMVRLPCKTYAPSCTARRIYYYLIRVCTAY